MNTVILNEMECSEESISKRFFISLCCIQNDNKKPKNGQKIKRINNLALLSLKFLFRLDSVFMHYLYKGIDWQLVLCCTFLNFLFFSDLNNPQLKTA